MLNARCAIGRHDLSLIDLQMMMNPSPDDSKATIDRQKVWCFKIISV
jgi:hypothetical protein